MGFRAVKSFHLVQFVVGSTGEYLPAKDIDPHKPPRSVGAEK